MVIANALEKARKSLTPEPKDTQGMVWTVEKKVKDIENGQNLLMKEMKQVSSKVDGMEGLFSSIREGQLKEEKYREASHLDLIKTIEEQREQIHLAALKIQTLKATNRPFWDNQKSALVSFFLTLLFGLISGYLQTKYNNIYSAWFFWFAALAALSTLAFVIGAAIKKSESQE